MKTEVDLMLVVPSQEEITILSQEEVLKGKLYHNYLLLRDMLEPGKKGDRGISRRPLRKIIRNLFHLLDKKEIFKVYQNCYDKLRGAVLWLREVVYTKTITCRHEGRKKQFYYVRYEALEPVCDRLGALLV
jgi:hypothetical protein